MVNRKSATTSQTDKLSGLFDLPQRIQETRIGEMLNPCCEYGTESN